MEEIGTYYGIRKGGIMNGYGKTPRRMSGWNITPYSKLFDPISGYGDKLRFTWYEDHMREKFGGTPTEIEVFKEPVNEDAFEEELMNAKKRRALEKLSEEEADALRGQMDTEPPRELNREAVTGGHDDLSFRGLVATNSDGKIIDSNGEVGSWKFDTFENVFKSYGGSGFVVSTLSTVLSVAEEHGGKVMRILVRMQDADFEDLKERAKAANAEKGKSKLDSKEKEALGLS